MATLIDKSYFNFDVSISDSAFNDVDNWIDRYEKEILTQLLGYELYKLVANSTDTSGRLYDLINGKEYTVSHNGRDQLVKWNGLINEDKVSLIAYYVYYQYWRHRTTLPTMTGRATPKLANSEPSTMAVNIGESWARLVELYGYAGQDELAPSCYNFLLANEADYPELIFTAIGSVNAFDL
jgi:hypothetical protein